MRNREGEGAHLACARLEHVCAALCRLLNTRTFSHAPAELSPEMERGGEERPQIR